MQKEKLEQLKKVFKDTAKKVFDKGYDNMIRLKETDKVNIDAKSKVS